MAETEAEKLAAEKAAQEKAVLDAKARAGDLEKELDRVTKKLQAKLDAEEEAKKAALAEQGKYKELYEGAEAKTKALLDPLTRELAVLKAKEEAHRKVLVDKLPEEKRAMYATIPTDALEDIVATFALPKPTSLAPPGNTIEDKKFDQLSPEEQIALKQSNPVLYEQKYREFYKRRTGKDPTFNL